jgi:N-acetylmuramate 1-kinase
MAKNPAHNTEFLDMALAGMDQTTGRETPLITPLAGDGSNRRLCRVCVESGTYILASNDPATSDVADNENRAWLAVHRYFESAGIPVPQVHHTDLSLGLFFMEDLGDCRLFELSRQPEAVESVSESYLAAVDLLTTLSRLPAAPEIATLNPPYSAEFIIKNESRYFHEEFLSRYCRLQHRFEEIAADCNLLAERALTTEPLLIHRDFQSRNLMLPDESQPERLVVIDFQGTRVGPTEYDLASLLFDPYQTLPDSLRIKLICRFLGIHQQKPAGQTDFLEWLTTSPLIDARWSDRFLANAANRLLQVHGAFAKLGARFGRPGFIEFMPAATRTLSRILAARGDCPRLEAVLRQAAKKSGISN